MIHTPVCDLLGIQLPIIAAPMGFITGPELAAAVSNAGGLGIMAIGNKPAQVARQEIRRLRELTDKPFGVNMLLITPQEELFNICLEEQVPIISFYLGDPSPYIERAHAAGIKVVNQVGSVETALRSVRAGVDVIIAQGFEAGGHVAGQVTTLNLVPRVVEAVAPVPVIAAGGFVDGRSLVAAWALGADGVAMGTRFLATPEAAAHASYKEKVVAASEEDTVHTILYGYKAPGFPHRVLRTPFVNEWLSEQTRGEESRPDEPVVAQMRMGNQTLPITRFMKLPPTPDTTGDIEVLPHYAGQSVGLIHEIKPAAQIVKEVVTQAIQIISERLFKIL